MIKEYGAPEIINSDQGSQYTSEEWLEACVAYGIKVSMDGRARSLDNIWIERFWRTIKREYISLNPEDNVVALRRGIAGFLIQAQNPGACLCDGCIGKKVMAKPKIITTFVSTSKTQSTTYSEGSAPRKH